MNLALTLALHNPPRGGGGGGYPLDGTPGAAGAWSVARRLLTSYTGPLIRVQTDDGESVAEMDVNALPNGALDSAGMIAWAAGRETRVIAVYDQSGEGRDMTHMSTWPPLIVGGGGVLVTNAGKPAMRFTGTDSLAIDGSFLGTMTAYSNAAGNADGSTFILWDLAEQDRFLAVGSDGDYYLQNGLNSNVAASGSNQLIAYVLADSQDSDELWVGNAMQASGAGGGGMAPPSYFTWGNNASGSGAWRGVVSELVLYADQYGSFAPATHAAIVGGLAL